MKIIKRDFAGHTVQPVDFIEEGTVDKERSTLSGASASFQIVTGSYDGLEVTDSNGVTLILRTDTVTSTQILPAAAVPFAGTTQDLKDLLKEFFFFDIGAGEGADNMISSYGDTGEYNQGHSAVKPAISTSTVMAVGTIYAIPVFLGGNIIEFTLVTHSAVAGINFNFALYEGSATGDYIPTNKIYQSAEFTTTAALEQLTIVVNLTLDKKWYYFAYTTDGSVTFRGTRVANSFLGWSGGIVLSPITRLFTAGAYASTLPAVFPAHFGDLANPSNPILFYKKDNS